MKKIIHLLRNYNNAICSGLLGGIFGISTTLIIINTAADNLTFSETVSWVFSSWFFSGCIGFYLTLKHRIPLPAAWSIPGVAIVAAGLTQYSLEELQGAYLVSGILLILLGYTKIIFHLLNWIPTPLVMAMIAGTLMRFPIMIITNASSDPILVSVILITFLIMTRFQKHLKVPPLLISLIVGIVISIITGKFDISCLSDISFIMPCPHLPSFNLYAIISVSIPLTIMVIGSENAQALGVLRSQGYDVPINSITILSGFGSILSSFFGAPNVNIAGPMTAICASEDAGDKKERYIAALIDASVVSLLGIFAFAIVPLAQNMSTDFITTVAGLAMINIITSSLKASFGQNKFSIGCLTAFLIALHNTSLFGIGAPFWAMIGGIFVSIIISPNDFFHHS